MIGGQLVRASLLVVSLTVVGSTVGCLPTGGILIRPAPADLTLQEHTVDADPGLFVSDKVLILDVDGVLMDAPTGGGPFGGGDNPVTRLVEQCEAAEADPAVKALVLRIDSPGGSVTASELMYQAVNRLKTKKRTDDKLAFPVVAMMMGTSASGGYYLAMAADEIYALPTTVTGSIGVIMILPDLHGLMDKIGVDVKAIKSGPAKDAGSPFRKLTDEEEQYFQREIVNRFYEQFKTVVAAGRPKLTPDRITALADGRVYLADAALQAGLIDKIATLEAAIARAAERAELTRKRVVMYSRPLGWQNTIYAHPSAPAATAGAAGNSGGASSGTTINLINLDGRGWPFSTGPQFLYLWQPGL